MELNQFKLSLQLSDTCLLGDEKKYGPARLDPGIKPDTKLQRSIPKITLFFVELLLPNKWCLACGLNLFSKKRRHGKVLRKRKTFVKERRELKSGGGKKFLLLPLSLLPRRGWLGQLGFAF